MHVLLKRKQRQEVKVSQVAGGIAEATGYHHGEASLIETIVGMAQQHVGTNNINLLKPEGQFGSRLAKPSVHAQARFGLRTQRGRGLACGAPHAPPY